jgi:hypothetical protein
LLWHSVLDPFGESSQQSLFFLHLSVLSTQTKHLSKKHLKLSLPVEQHSKLFLHFDPSSIQASVGEPEGKSEGMEVGKPEGWFVVGIPVGSADAMTLGWFEGSPEAITVGSPDTIGIPLGIPEGPLLGVATGILLGIPEGPPLGILIGIREGFPLGDTDLGNGIVGPSVSIVGPCIIEGAWAGPPKVRRKCVRRARLLYERHHNLSTSDAMSAIISIIKLTNHCRAL